MTLYDPLSFIYVLEGPDHAGKTTTAKQISDVARHEGHNVQCVHFGPSTGMTSYTLFEQYVSAVAKAAWESVTSNTVTIFDRLHVGEWVYGNIIRHHSLLTLDQIIAIDQMLSSVGAKKFHVTARNSTLQERHLKLGDDYISKDELRVIQQQYIDMLKNPRFQDWHVLDTTFTVAPS